MPTYRLFVQVTGWLCVGSLALLLYRSVVGKTVKLFPFFYSYIAHILITTAIGLSVKWPSTQAYRTYWWAVECVSMLVAVGVTWEIFRKILVHYPGVRRLAAMLLSIIFGSVLLVSATGRGDEKFSMVGLDRDVRTVQAIVLLILFALVAYYGVPLGRNIRGIAIGYVFAIATGVLNLSLSFYFGKSYELVWRYGRTLEYLASVGIWCTTLWSYYAEPAPPNNDIERDYEWISGRTMHAMNRLRTHLIHPDGT